MSRRDRTTKWILAVPVLCMVGATWLFVQGEGKPRGIFERARDQWRASDYDTAAELFDDLVKKYPESSYADDALWEGGLVRYLNLYDVDAARHAFERLVEEYPDSPLVSQGHLKLAEIYEIEMNELGQVNFHLRAALLGSLSSMERRSVQFDLAQNYFLLGEYERSLDIFSTLSDSLPAGDLAQWARVRTGTILQVQKRYEESVAVLEEVLVNPECPICRQQARLELIESFEFLDQLPRAIEVASDLDTRYYPPDLKQRLLTRLSEKRQYFEPKLWNTGR